MTRKANVSKKAVSLFMALVLLFSMAMPLVVNANETGGNLSIYGFFFDDGTLYVAESFEGRIYINGNFVEYVTGENASFFELHVTIPEGTPTIEFFVVYLDGYQNSGPFVFHGSDLIPLGEDSWQTILSLDIRHIREMQASTKDTPPQQTPEQPTQPDQPPLISPPAPPTTPPVPPATTGETGIYLDGVRLVSDVAPFIYDSRTMVPVRLVGEALGARFSWDDERQMVHMFLEETSFDRGTPRITVSMQIDRTTVQVDRFGERSTYQLDVPAMLIDSRTFVPLRFLAEIFGFDVDWCEETESVLITTPTP